MSAVPMRPMSLCTVCAGRFSDLRQIADATCQWIVERGDSVEWIVLEYEPTFGVEELLKGVSRKYGMGSRLCHVVRSVSVVLPFESDGVTRVGSFALARAKNLAHMHGGGLVRVNLDADNLVGEFEAALLGGVLRQWREAEGESKLLLNLNVGSTVFAPSGRAVEHSGFDGCGGRIAIGCYAFAVLGGYDERFIGYGGDDTDIVWRAEKAEREDRGVSYVEVPCKVGCWDTSEEVYAQCWPNKAADYERNIRLLAHGGSPIPANRGEYEVDSCVRWFYE